MNELFDKLIMCMVNELSMHFPGIDREQAETAVRFGFKRFILRPDEGLPIEVRTFVTDFMTKGRAL